VVIASHLNVNNLHANVTLKRESTRKTLSDFFLFIYFFLFTDHMKYSVMKTMKQWRFG